MVSLFWRFFWHQLAAQQLWWWWLKTKLTFHRVAYFNNQKFLYLMKPFLSQKSWQDAASCLLLSLLLRSNLLHLSFDLFIEQKNIFQLLYQRLTRRNWLVRVAASAHFLYSLNRKKKELKLDPTSRSTIQNKLVVNRPKVQWI